MSNILTARVTVCGLRPLMWHSFGLDSIPLQKKERAGVAGHDPTEWRRTVLLDEDRRPYVPDTYLFGSLRDGAKFTKRGRGSLQPLVASTLQVRDERVIVGDQPLPEPLTTDPTQPLYLDIRSVRNPTTGARNIRYRVAASAGWRLSFAIQWDKTVISRSEMEAVIIDAGKLAGIGNARQIGFGRYALEHFTLTDES
jgi:hypothetical protein